MTEESLTDLDLAKMILIYEMMLQALVDKGDELVNFMVPCASPRERTKMLLEVLNKNESLCGGDKEYYRDVIETTDRIWLDWRSKYNA